MKTYNQVIKVLSDIAGAHQQVETFGEGDVWDIAENTAYPLMYVTPQPGSLNIERSETSLSLSIIFADLAKEDKSNEAEVRSDMQQVAFDVLAQLQLPDYVDLFTVVPSARLTPFSDAHPDRVTGWVLDLTLRMDYLSDWCIVPSTLSPGTVLGCPTVEVYDSAGTLLATVAAGGTYTVTDTTVKNSAGTTIGTGVAQSIITLSDKVFTDYDGTTSALVQGVDKSATQLTRIYPTFPTGQTIIYRTGDDAWVQQNIFSPVSATGYIITLDPLDRRKVSDNESYGHKFRNVGATGGYYDHLTSQYKTQAGVVTTYAASFPGDYYFDRYTGMGWYLIRQPAITWNAAIDAALAASIVVNGVTYDDWFVPSSNMLATIINQSTIQPILAYLPWNVVLDTVSSSTTYLSATTQLTGWWVGAGNPGLTTPIPKSNSEHYLICRKAA